MRCWGISHVNYVGVHEVKAQKRPKTIWFGFPGSLGDLGGLEYGKRNNAWNMAKETMPSLVSFLGLQCSRVVDVNGKLLMSWLTMSCIVDAKNGFHLATSNEAFEVGHLCVEFVKWDILENARSATACRCLAPCTHHLSKLAGAGQ